MTPKQAIGRIVSFDLTMSRVVGEVIAASPAPNNPRGNIPDLLLTVKGRTGRVLIINLVDSYTRFHESWEEALKNP